MIMDLLCNVVAMFDSTAGNIPSYFTSNVLLPGDGPLIIEKWPARVQTPALTSDPSWIE